MENNRIVEEFYTAFASGDSEGMIACYHDDVVFEDPAFGVLRGARAKAMWQMLLGKGSSEITFENVTADDAQGKANWVAKYNYGPKGRKVVNHVSANFQFSDGKIIAHKDDFDLWKWSQQALGTPGYLLGWSSFMKNKIQKTTKESLDKFMSN